MNLAVRRRWCAAFWALALAGCAGARGASLAGTWGSVDTAKSHGVYQLRLTDNGIATMSTFSGFSPAATNSMAYDTSKPGVVTFGAGGMQTVFFYKIDGDTLSLSPSEDMRDPQVFKRDLIVPAPTLAPYHTH